MSTNVFPAWVSGAVFQPGQPSFAVEDEGFLLGLSVFDSLLWDRGCLLFFEKHMQRFQRGIEELGITWPLPWDPRMAVDELVEAIVSGPGSHEQLILRLTATRGVPGCGANLAVTARPFDELPKGGVLVALAGEFKAIGDRCEGIKSTNRLRNILAREAGRAQGAWEVLFSTTEGDLSEGTITNLFAVLTSGDGARIVTPAEERGCLAGIVRSLVIEDLQREPLSIDGRDVPLEVGKISGGDLEGAAELFLTNTSQRVIPIREVLGKTKGLLGVEGPVTLAVAARIAALESDYRARNSISH